MAEGLVSTCFFCFCLRTGCILISLFPITAFGIGFGYHYIGEFDPFMDYWWIFFIIYFPPSFEVLNSLAFLISMKPVEDFAKVFFMEACAVKLAMDLALALFFLVVGVGDKDTLWDPEHIHYYAISVAIIITILNFYFFIVAHSYKHEINSALNCAVLNSRLANVSSVSGASSSASGGYSADSSSYGSAR